MSEPRRLTGPYYDNKDYYGYRCVECGNEATNTYCEPERSRMLAARHCFYCDFYEQLGKSLEIDHATRTIIDGHLYTPGNRTSGEFRGMAGRRFDIEYVAPSIFAGQRCTTFDLWSGSTLPDKLRERFCDTAVFLNDAQRFAPSEKSDGCWNASSRKSEPYPLPEKLQPSPELR